MYLCHRLSSIFPSPFPLPTKQPGTQAGAGEKLPESLVFPPQHPSFPPAQLPALPSHSLQQSGGRQRCCRKLRAGAGGDQIPPDCQNLASGYVWSGFSHPTFPLPDPSLCTPSGAAVLGEGSSADWEALEQGCSLKINRCYLCNSKSREERREKKNRIRKKCLGISQLTRLLWLCLNPPYSCPAAGWCVVGVCVCVCLHLDLC